MDIIFYSVLKNYILHYIYLCPYRALLFESIKSQYPIPSNPLTTEPVLQDYVKKRGLMSHYETTLADVQGLAKLYQQHDKTGIVPPHSCGV